MLNLDNITIVSVACVRADQTLKAIKYSCKDIKFHAAKLITNENLQDEHVEIIKINKLDYENYNKFIVYDLFKYIDTEFALVIQDDGFVVNSNSWNNEFLKYDYIGAPWPLPKDNFSYRSPFNEIIRVGNGGFSLRSKKLMALPSTLNIEWKCHFGFCHEDGFISIHNRHIFEQNGCKFAPIDIAKYFSHEVKISETEGIEPFGFHSKFSKYMGLIN